MSNVYKSSAYVSLEEIRLIQALEAMAEHASRRGKGNGAVPLANGESDEPESGDWEAIREEKLKEAEAAAREIVQAAEAEAEALREKARQEVEAWWNERRSQDEQRIAEARQTGFEEGYREGLVRAEEKVLADYREQIEQAKAVVEQAYAVKQQIIREAEPFLVQLSISVAEKIIHRQLTEHPEWVVELIRRQLSRKRNKGSISVCVSPQNYSFVQNAREELSLLIDPEAELLIVPDAGVKDHGCVIRTPLGSIDARIDTQLAEIKEALLQIAHQQEEADFDGENVGL